MPDGSVRCRASRRVISLRLNRYAGQKVERIEFVIRQG
jgi:hypothetical protein